MKQPADGQGPAAGRRILALDVGMEKSVRTVRLSPVDAFPDQFAMTPRDRAI